MFKKIIDEDIELKILEEIHTKEDYLLIDKNRNYLRQWLPWVDNTKSCEDVNKFIKSCLEQFANNEGFTAGIWYRGEFAGVIGYHELNRSHKKVNIGYWLGSEFTGLGIMIRSCKAMVDYAFSELGLHRVEIRCAEGNVKSRAIPKQLGFKNEGILREVEWLYDHYVSHVVYSMLDIEWNITK
ncbi:GNAT family N-acetyltransferase [Tepidibacter aestuarii]|uniref:GNAT family N-acetyltransferase n=1 Tax=Tepidibacter aestuarii TaxID=2925782 RepID=UPI0020C09964|nr:GNAT family protein [Tepidibacter aestuarii]CAH2214235.1 ribosomal-protein-serine acetyltransferase [Tepidibacter aestuarii]